MIQILLIHYHTMGRQMGLKTETWALFQYKDHLSIYVYSHYKGKIIMRLSYPYTVKIASLYWDSPLFSLGPQGFNVNTLSPRQNGRHFPDDIFKRIFLNKNVWILIKISLKFVPKGPINNIKALVQIMAWHRPGDKPLSEPMMVKLLTHICVTWPQWVKTMLMALCKTAVSQFLIIHWWYHSLTVNHICFSQNKYPDIFSLKQRNHSMVSLHSSSLNVFSQWLLSVSAKDLFKL